MTQEELRNAYIKLTEREKQVYISKKTGINASVLTKFKKGDIDLYPYLFKKLEAYVNGDLHE